ncbi:phage tail protein [Tenacibaculum agarivorans]|uniref:phage tail protein n=1 Tax=Tenacibaculum agarivorans TaxID=1908389 RepID=UPI00094BA9EC|nr:tail fiber protein [Tenacibaculum agarivorans]
MDPFLGQIQTFGFNFAPRGWSTCSGQLLAIASHSALFSLLGTTYGGDGRTTFALPDLRGRSIVGVGHGAGLSTITWGERGGIEYKTLNILEMPSHNHIFDPTSTIDVSVSTLNNGSATNETGNGENILGTEDASLPEIYREPGSGTAGKLGGVTVTGSASGTITHAGGSQSFNIRNPFLGMYVCIAMVGIFPSRS